MLYGAALSAMYDNIILHDIKIWYTADCNTVPVLRFRIALSTRPRWDNIVVIEKNEF